VLTAATRRDGNAAARARPAVGDVAIGVVFLLLAIASLGLGEPTLVQNIVVTDLLLAGVIVTWMIHASRGDSRSQYEASRLVLPLSLVFGGSLLASIHVGTRSFVVDDLLRDAGAFAVFLGALDMFRRYGVEVRRWALVAVFVAVTVLSLSMLGDETLRGSATFPNPNIPAHLLASALLLFVLAPVPNRLRIAAVVAIAFGMLRAGSFGAALQAAVGFTYIAFARTIVRTRQRERTRVALLGLLAAAGATVVVLLRDYMTDAPDKVDAGLSAARLDRSLEGRLEVWDETFHNFLAHPFGTGPGSSRALQLLQGAPEPHSEPLAYLAERGVVAFVGLALLWVVLWRFMRPGGIARAMFCGYLVNSLFRETLHYRHWWLLLPLAMVIDERGLGAGVEHDAQGAGDLRGSPTEPGATARGPGLRGAT
jgi:hypothetical protein